MKKIAGKIIFISSESVLKSCINDSFYKKVPGPSSRILEALLNREGEIIKYQCLYKAGWGDNHINIKPNTLYQSVSILRRTFEEFGVDGRIITTHPRKGLSIELNDDSNGIWDDIEYHINSPPNVDEKKPKEEAKVNLFLAALSIPFILLSSFIDLTARSK